jgi:pimeloyl-ACP methyl ester carboxylesterase
MARAPGSTTHAADGTEIAWWRVGSGSPVVLVHGITESGASWDPLVQRLARTRTVLTLDLRGHGSSGRAASYDLAAMASDVVAVLDAADVDASDVDLVGHSLGGAVVTAVGAAVPVRSVVDVDQALRLGEFKDQLVAAEPMLRDAAHFGAVIDMLFDSMRGDLLGAEEVARLSSLRHAEQDVVLGVWDLLLTASPEEIAATVDAALAGYRDRTPPTPHLALFGLDPGPDYDEWLGARVPGAVVERWPDHGHYPHLVDPDRFVERLSRFWG